MKISIGYQRKNVRTAESRYALCQQAYHFWNKKLVQETYSKYVIFTCCYPKYLH